MTGEYKDASKNVRMYLRHSSNVIVDLWYMILNHFGVNHFISVILTNCLLMDGWMDRPMDRQPIIEICLKHILAFILN